jgi:hypothetical protein
MKNEYFIDDNLNKKRLIKTQKEAYEILLKNKEKIPNDIWDIYLSKKKNLKWLWLDNQNFEEKEKFLKWLSEELYIYIINRYYVKDFLIRAWRANVYHWDSFLVFYRTEYNKIVAPYGIICSRPFKYFYIRHYEGKTLRQEDMVIITYIRKFLEKKWYRELSKEIVKIETDIIWDMNMPYENFKNRMIKSSEIEKDYYFLNMSEEEKKDYILWISSGMWTCYDWVYTIHDVVFGEPE